MEWSIKAYDELKLSELYALLELRAKVFVVEQDCAYKDLDGNDPNATHLLCFQKNKLIAYSRIFGPGAFEKKTQGLAELSHKNKVEEKELATS